MSNIYRVVDLERCSKDEKYLSRNLGYSRSDHTLCIKLPDGNWLPISGGAKQNKLTAGSNVDEKKLYEEGTIATVPDVDIDTMTLDSENPFQPLKHKGLVKLSEVHNSAFIPLIKDGSGDLLGGECILSVTVDGRTTFNHLYIINIADGSTLSKGCSIQGGSGSDTKAAIVEVSQEAIGLYYQSTTGNIPTKLEMWFRGWDMIRDRSLLNTTIDDISDMRFLARA